VLRTLLFVFAGHSFNEKEVKMGLCRTLYHREPEQGDLARVYFQELRPEKPQLITAQSIWSEIHFKRN